MLVNEYRVRCLTDTKDEITWGLTPPITCPINTAHDIDPALTIIIRSTSLQQVNVVDADGTFVNHPRTSGGTPLYNPTIVPAGYYLYVTSAFDLTDTPGVNTVAAIDTLTPIVGEVYELSDAGTLGTLAVVAGDKILYEGGQWWKYAMPARGIGPQIGLTQVGPGKTTMQGRFQDHIYILGGAIGSSSNAEPGDWMSMKAFAPASVPAAVEVGAGNAVKEAYGPINRFKPDAVNGNYNVDGTTMEVGEINLNLTPVPNAGSIGYWNWDPTASPSITPVIDPAIPDGAFDLFDVPLDLVRQANRISLMIGGDITPPSLKGKKMLPHWVMVFTLMRAEAVGTLKATARITAARFATV